MDDVERKLLPKCIWGDGCLLRLSDQRHADTYAHTTSMIPECPIEECPLYQIAYDFVVGQRKERTPEISKAQQHAALHYHRPLRSQSVIKERLPEPQKARRRSTSEKELYAPPRHVRKSSDLDGTKRSTPIIPKLDLSMAITSPGSPMMKESHKFEVKSAPSLRPEPDSDRPSLISSHAKSSSDPARKTAPSQTSPKNIALTPKRRSSSIGNAQLDVISKELDDLRDDVKHTNKSFDDLKGEISSLRQDVREIKELLLAGSSKDAPTGAGADTTRYHSSDEEKS
jgi:hypothetical protein